MNEVRKSKLSRSRMASLAGVLFCLAGLVELAAGLAHRGMRPVNMMFVGVAVLFGCVGLLWIAIGVKFRRAEKQAASGG